MSLSKICIVCGIVVKYFTSQRGKATGWGVHFVSVNQQRYGLQIQAETL